MNEPLVSIIIPCYNAEKYIGETIESVVNQSYQNWELIIVNDGSKDDSEEIIKPFLNDKRIRYLNKKNEGVSKTRNTGIEYAKGEFIAFLDADDVWLPERNEKLINHFLLNPTLGLLHSWQNIIDAKSNYTQTILKGKQGWILEDLLLWNGTCIPAPSSILVKREVLEKCGGFNENLSTAADQEFFFRVAAKFEIGMVMEVLGLYRVHDNNMHQNIQRMELDHLRAYAIASHNKLFSSIFFKLKCFANLYLILAGSWWVDGQNKLRGIYFIAKAIVTYPPIFLKLIKKFLH